VLSPEEESVQNETMVVDVFHNISLHAHHFYHSTSLIPRSGKLRPRVRPTGSLTGLDMSTTQGSISFANRMEISNSMRAGLLAHKKRLERFEKSEWHNLTVTQKTEEQRLFMSRAVSSSNVFESEKDTETMTKQEKDGSLKRKRKRE
jgi:hypothetical protein